MSVRDLLVDPVWEASELGQPLPDSVHAVSVALPRWQDVVGYEEKWPEVIGRLQSGYPRFVIHPLVQEVADRLGGGRPALPFPSEHVAQLCVAFIRRQNHEDARIISKDSLHAVLTSEAGFPFLKAFWQHTGLILSSRQAEAFLSQRPQPSDHLELRATLRAELARLYDCGAHDVFLQPTGMAAGFAALRSVLRRRPGLRTVQVGFPYVDTFKLQEKFGPGVTMLHDLEHADRELSSLLELGPLAGCFSEIPGNPLLGSADLRMLSPILRAHGIPLVADDVVATPLNVDLGSHADLIATSLTKYLAGSGDVMGGALICNPCSPYYHELKSLVEDAHEELLWGEDARLLAASVVTFPQRMKRHNENGLLIAERLRAHPAVQQVWYPRWSNSEAYEAVRRTGGGWGSLLTFLPRDAERTAPLIYDNLQLCKGPSLGTSFTLACPFTLLAHYTELDWAESCGVPRNLIRLSVGVEDPEELWRRIEKALPR